MALRTALRLFLLANDAYANAKITAYKVDAQGNRLGILATLHDSPVAGLVAPNPFNLDGDGKLGDPVYHEEPIICSIEGINVPAHDTGVIGLDPIWKAEYQSGVVYFAGNMLRDPTTKRVFIVQRDYTSVSLSADLSAGNLSVVLDTVVVASTQLTRHTATGNGVTVAFTLPVSPANDRALIVSVNGVITIAWTLAGATVTFSVAPPNGQEIVFHILATLDAAWPINGVVGSIIQDGDGALAQPADIVIKGLTFDIYEFGCDPAATAAYNSQQIAKAVAAANSLGRVLTAGIRPGTYQFNDAIPALTTARGLDQMGSKFISPGTTGPFLQFGRVVAGGVIAPVLRNIRVERVSPSGWLTDGEIGVLLRCLRATDIDIAEINGFTVGLRVQGERDGATAADFVHNTIRIGQILNTRYAVDMYSQSSDGAGAPNQNVLIGGNIVCDTGLNTDIDRYGWCFRRATGGYANHNSNVWLAPAFQHASPGAGVAYCVLSEANPVQNTVHNARAEWGAATMRASLTRAGGGSNKITVDYATSYLPAELFDAFDTGATKAAWRTVNNRYSQTLNESLRPLIVVPNLRGTMFKDQRNSGVESAFSYGFDDVHITYTVTPTGGVGVADIEDCVMRNDQRGALIAAHGIIPNAESITIGSARGIGVIVDTHECKWLVPMISQENGARSYRFAFRLFDTNKLLLGDTVPIYADMPSFTLGWNATGLYWYPGNNQTDANQASRVAYRVPDIAKWAQVAIIFPGDADIENIQNFAVYTPEPYQARAWHGVPGGTRELHAEAAWNPASIASGASATTTVAVPGAAPGDICAASFNLSLAGLMISAYSNANDVVTVALSNLSGGAVDLADGIVSVRAMKRRV